MRIDKLKRVNYLEDIETKTLSDLLFLRIFRADIRYSINRPAPFPARAIDRGIKYRANYSKQE